MIHIKEAIIVEGAYDKVRLNSIVDGVIYVTGGFSFMYNDECIETIETLEDMDEWEQKEVVALMEYLCTENAHEAIDEKDNYIFYGDIDEYYDFCDENIDFGGNDFLERYL